jgi:hypothetical protein
MSGKGKDNSLIAIDRFIQATRDSGYKGTQSAIAELVDNSIQAGADTILIHIEPAPGSVDDIRVEVIDNGCGMTSITLQQALRFGGTTRFNDRLGLGRYGMGLPNSSLSQARRLDVHTWRSSRQAFTSFLDVDEIARGKITSVPEPSRTALPPKASALGFRSGTIVTWSSCDRLEYRRPTTIARKLQVFLGRVFRYFLWSGTVINVNGEPVKAIDPLFLSENSLTRGGRLYGVPLIYELEIPLRSTGEVASGTVSVRFSELPVAKWHKLSNEEKNALGILKAAGVSVVRSGREIDYGWFLMGEKRKENYDDWWRCEICFDPGLDEAFGITHTKQQIRPIQDLLQVLVPDLEATAKALNRRVRQAHERLRSSERAAPSEAMASSREHLLSPLARTPTASQKRELGALARLHPRLLGNGEDNAPFNSYAIVEGDQGLSRFFHAYYDGSKVILALNTDHPFYKRLYRPLAEREDNQAALIRKQIDLLLLAAARAEISSGQDRAVQFIEEWSNIMAMFLQS